MPNEFWVKLVVYTNTDPVFKGLAVTLVGLLSLLFAWWMKKRWREPLKGGFGVFIGLAILITLYGLVILLIRPHWWNPPY
jgi:hypothetical protein